MTRFVSWDKVIREFHKCVQSVVYTDSQCLLNILNILTKVKKYIAIITLEIMSTTEHWVVQHTHSSTMSHIVPLYASVLGGLFIHLSLSTIKLRRKHRVATGDAGVQDLQKVIRAHSNFAEYTPLSLMLLYFVELYGGYPKLVVHALCLTLCIGRSIHAYGVSQVKEVFKYRVWYGHDIHHTLISVYSALPERFLFGRFGGGTIVLITLRMVVANIVEDDSKVVGVQS